MGRLVALCEEGCGFRWWGDRLGRVLWGLGEEWEGFGTFVLGENSVSFLVVRLFVAAFTNFDIAATNHKPTACHSA